MNVKIKDELLSKIVTGGSFSLLIRVVGVLLMFLAHALLSRAMGNYNYGIFVYALSMIPIIALVTRGGFQVSSLRFLHEYNNRSKIELKSGYIRRSFQIPLLFSLVVFIAATVSGFFFDQLPKIIGESAKYASWIIILFSLASISQRMLRAMKKIVYSQIFEQVGLPLVLTLAATYFLVGNHSLDYQTAFVVYGLAYLLILTISWYLVLKIAGVGWGTQSQYDSLNWIRVSIPLGLVGSGLVFMTRLDIMLLGFFVGPDQIAQYGVASRIAGLTVFCMAALSTISGPYISELYHGGQYQELKLLLRKIVFFAIASNALFWLFLLIFGDYLLLAFGEQYQPLKTIMLILAAGRLSGIGLTLVGPILTISGHQKEYMYFLLLMSAILFFSLYFSVQNYGVMGAAITTTTVMVVTNIAVFLLIYKCVGINLFTISTKAPPDADTGGP